MSKNKKEKKKFEPSEESAIHGLETYATHTILYLNDCAANYCLDICRAVDNAGYRGNGAKKICTGLKNRADEYFRVFNTIFEKAMDDIADFNCIYDDKCDDAIIDFRKAIRETLEPYDIEHKDFIAMVETCRSIVEFACDINDHFVERLKNISPITAKVLPNWKPISLLNTINSLSDFVVSVIPETIHINLNENEKVIESFRVLTEDLFGYQNFKRAYRKTYKNK